MWDVMIVVIVYLEQGGILLLWRGARRAGGLSVLLS